MFVPPVPSAGPLARSAALLLLGCLAGWPVPAPAADPATARIQPSLANVPYGPDPAQVLDFYRADAVFPTPLVFFIHGGGWVAGSKANIPGLEKLLRAKISVVSVEYRFVQRAALAGVKPPVSWPLHDAARALQFVRSKASDWNLDKARVGASGGSAGACSSLWLAFHDDLADPTSADPVSRESTRLWCAAVDGAQTSLDPAQLQEWTPNSRYGGHAFGFFDPNDLKTRDTRFAEFLANRESVLPWIRQYSPIEHVSAGDPPVFLTYRDTPAMGEPQKDPTHTANYGIPLREKCRAVGVECLLQYPGAEGVPYPTSTDFLIATLNRGR